MPVTNKRHPWMCEAEVESLCDPHIWMSVETATALGKAVRADYVVGEFRSHFLPVF